GRCSPPAAAPRSATSSNTPPVSQVQVRIADTAGRVVRGYCLLLGIGLFAEGTLLLLWQWLTPYAGDVRHNLLHVAWGAVILALVTTDRSQLRATQVALVFGVFYTALAILGVITTDPFGLQLGPGENTFH